MKLNVVERAIQRFVGPLIESPPAIVRMTFLRGEFRIPDPDNRKIVYLTFDDGPIPESTPWLLDTLDRLDVKATFFMVGDNVRKYPRLYKEVLERGHKVGNHTMHHLNGLIVPTTKYVRDVDEASRYIKSSLLRPPHGWMRLPQREYLSRKYRIVMYDVVTRDYSKYVSARKVVENIRKYSRPGAIIVFHDSLKSIDKLKTALPESIGWLREMGYAFQTIDDKK